jgi:hypothetical protein
MSRESSSDCVIQTSTTFQRRDSIVQFWRLWRIRSAFDAIVLVLHSVQTGIRHSLNFFEDAMPSLMERWSSAIRMWTRRRGTVEPWQNLVISGFRTICGRLPEMPTSQRFWKPVVLSADVQLTAPLISYLDWSEGHWDDPNQSPYEELLSDVNITK